MDVTLVINEAANKTHLVRSIPEKGDRIDAVIKKLTATGTLTRLQSLVATPATEQDVLGTHSLAYLNDFRASVKAGNSQIDYTAITGALDPRSESLVAVHSGNAATNSAAVLAAIRASAAYDTPLTSSTFDAALHSAGSMISAIESILAGNPRRAFCLTRPPGHHAEFDTAMGFCFFNNVAVGAQYLLGKQHAQRVAIIDFDVHHGNGSQHLFYQDPRVLVYNIHRDPSSFYPYFCGHASEAGTGAGAGFNVNVPLQPGSSGTEYRRAFDALAKRIDDYKPEWLLVSAGFDAHKSDPLGGMRLDSKDYNEFARRLAELADTHCGGRMVSILEGGYNLGALSACVDSYLQGLLQS